jgi:hypothetical protein
MKAERRGVTVFRAPTPITAAGARALFSFYLDSMSTQGWTLLGKGDPTRDGWTLRWQFQQQAVLLAFTTATQRLEVDLCPPRPYC